MVVAAAFEVQEGDAGAATVWGMVESDAERLAIGVAAERVPGVSRVENNINVMPAMVRATMGAQ